MPNHPDYPDFDNDDNPYIKFEMEMIQWKSVESVSESDGNIPKRRCNFDTEKALRFANDQNIWCPDY